MQIPGRDLVRNGRLVEPGTLVRCVGRTLTPGTAALRERPGPVTPPLTLRPPFATLPTITAVPAFATLTTITAEATLTTLTTITAVATLTTLTTAITAVPALTTLTTITVRASLTSRTAGIRARSRARGTIAIHRAPTGTVAARSSIVTATRTALFLFRHGAPYSRCSSNAKWPPNDGWPF
ncbi:MAG: hypothetical protein E2584_00200 [Microbacterium sp.]|nr:hypothetical protein [Microbacterium sp.]